MNINKHIEKIKSTYQNKKKQIIDLNLGKKFNELPNWAKLLFTLPISFFLFIFLSIYFDISADGANAPFWTFLTVIISSPIAFIVWHFRDQNATQQIENQRKDINLKEFQKIAEWVSGLHLIEDEITEKTATKDGKQELETTTKYTQQNSAQSIPTFSKRDGAVGLQIAAIHSLLPFFRGEHGESFRRPALNLLTSAWISLQQKDLAILEAIDVLKSPDKFDTQIKKIQNNAKSPIGVALTQVLLSDGGDNLLEFPEVFPNLCLAGMDFHLPGLDKDVLSLFVKKKQDCSGVNLTGCNLESANLQHSKLNKANLTYANLSKANLANANLDSANLMGVNFNNTNFTKCKLVHSNFNHIRYSQYMNLTQADLTFVTINLYLGNPILTACLIDFAGLYHYTHEKITQLKQAGAIILHSTNDTDEIIAYYVLEKVIILELKDKRSGNSYISQIKYSLDLEKTRQENPDWEITVQEIREE